jgi:thiol-disulfide isomerase/thioredoxin
MKNTCYVLLIFTAFVISSCSRTEDNISLLPPTADIVVDDLVRKTSLRNQEIPFKIINELGEDISLQATFFVNDSEIQGNVFTSGTIGEFEVYGVYTENGTVVTTNTETFDVIIPKRKVVVEDYTGTWCGYCPIVTAAIDDAHDMTDDLTIITIHKTGSGDPDLLHFPQVDELRDAFGVFGYPTAKINRTINWSNPYSLDEITNLTGLDTNIGIAINSELSTDTNDLIIEVELVNEQSFMIGDKLVVYLLESGILQDQVNYYNDDPTSPYYQLGNPIPNFEQNHGLRNSLTNLTGDAISSTAALATYNRTFSFSIPENYNTANMSLVVLVVNSDNTALNSQFAELGENKPYE